MSDPSVTVESYGPNAVAELEMSRNVCGVLEAEYPGHAWFVDSNKDAGTVTVQLMYQQGGKTMRWKWGYLMHWPALEVRHELERKVKLAGGECLERCRLPRGVASIDAPVIAALHGLDLQGAQRG
jgi:hypothetical protein